ncbi:MAG TPA: electron transfer flavoprotein subunit beta/FixA family protein [Rugosimonospora sp.]|nr:electron transfer flavoprotein subunit beta/FixA family protein [Rugosimonospora sp.]
MRIVVLVKHVPRVDGGLSYAPDLTVDRSRLPAGLNDADRYALGQALRIALRRRDVQITAVTMGPAGAVDTLRAALGSGADEGVHVRDAALHGCDALATSKVLAAAVARVGFDLVLCGAASADSGMAAVPAMVAERLGVAGLCFADALTVRERRVEIRRDDGGGLSTFSAALPAVISVTERCGEPRYPRYPDIAEARGKPVRTWSAAELGIAAGEVGLAAAASVVRAVTPRAGGRRGLVVAGDPTSVAVRVADFLVERQFL